MFTNLGIEQLRRAARDGFKRTQVLEARHTTDDLLSALVQQVEDLSIHAFNRSGDPAIKASKLSCQLKQQIAGTLSEMLLSIVQLADALQIDLGKAALHQITQESAKYQHYHISNDDTLRCDQQQQYTTSGVGAKLLDSCGGDLCRTNSTWAPNSPQTTAEFICSLPATNKVAPLPNELYNNIDLGRGILTAQQPTAAALQATAAAAGVSVGSPINSRDLNALVPGSGSVSPSYKQQQSGGSSPCRANCSSPTKLVSSPDLVSASDEVLVRQDSGFLPQAAVGQPSSTAAANSSHVTMGADSSNSSSTADSCHGCNGSKSVGSPVHQVLADTCFINSLSADTATSAAASPAAAAHMGGSCDLAAALSSSAESMWLAASAIAANDANSVARALMIDSSNDSIFPAQLSISAHPDVAFNQAGCNGCNGLGSGGLLDSMVAAAQVQHLLPTAQAHTNNNIHAAAAAAALSPAFLNQAMVDPSELAAWSSLSSGSSNAALSPAHSLGLLMNNLDPAAAAAAASMLPPLPTTIPMSTVMPAFGSGPASVSSTNNLMMMQAAAAAAGVSTGACTASGLSSPVNYIPTAAVSDAAMAQAAAAADICARCGGLHSGRCPPKAKCPRCYRRAHSGDCWVRCIYCNLVHAPGKCKQHQQPLVSSPEHKMKVAGGTAASCGGGGVAEHAA